MTVNAGQVSNGSSVAAKVSPHLHQMRLQSQSPLLSWRPPGRKRKSGWAQGVDHQSPPEGQSWQQSWPGLPVHRTGSFVRRGPLLRDNESRRRRQRSDLPHGRQLTVTPSSRWWVVSPPLMASMCILSWSAPVRRPLMAPKSKMLRSSCRYTSTESTISTGNTRWAPLVLNGLLTNLKRYFNNSITILIFKLTVCQWL